MRSHLYSVWWQSANHSYLQPIYLPCLVGNKVPLKFKTKTCLDTSSPPTQLYICPLATVSYLVSYNPLQASYFMMQQGGVVTITKPNAYLVRLRERQIDLRSAAFACIFCSDLASC